MLGEDYRKFPMKAYAETINVITEDQIMDKLQKKHYFSLGKDPRKESYRSESKSLVSKTYDLKKKKIESDYHTSLE